MSRKKSREELEQHSEKALKQIKSYIDDLLSSGNPDNNGRADKLLYWLEDYISFLRIEETFKPQKMKRYKRGDVIKVHLGYNVGSEEGGLHFAIVLDNNNSLFSNILTVVPLTSIKSNKEKQEYDPRSINLGDEIYNSFYHTITNTIKNLENRIELLEKEHKIILQSAAEQETKIASGISEEELDILMVQKIDNQSKVQDITQKCQQYKKECCRLKKALTEIKKMKTGSIALISQIRTISKIRVYNPKNSYDTLNGVRVSAETLDKIDRAIADLYQNTKIAKRLKFDEKTQKNS